jgi:hypothetical protein
VVAVRGQPRPHRRRLEAERAVGSDDDVQVVALVAAQEAQRVPELVRQYREQIEATEGRRRRIVELRVAERRRVDEPAVAVGVAVEDDPALGGAAGRVELRDVPMREGRRWRQERFRVLMPPLKRLRIGRRRAGGPMCLRWKDVWRRLRRPSVN